MKTSSVVRTILKNNENKILLVKHQQASFWALPGGHIEQGEDLYEALHREIKEEFNLKIEILGKKQDFNVDTISELPLPISIYKINYTSKKHGDVSKLEYIFNAKIVSGDIKVQEEEIEQYGFFTKDEILEMNDVYSQIKDLL